MLFVTTQMAHFTVRVITVIQGMESTVQTWMSATWKLIVVMYMPLAPIPKDHSLVPVIEAFMELAISV